METSGCWWLSLCVFSSACGFGPQFNGGLEAVGAGQAQVVDVTTANAAQPEAVRIDPAEIRGHKPMPQGPQIVGASTVGVPRHVPVPQLHFDPAFLAGQDLEQAGKQTCTVLLSIDDTGTVTRAVGVEKDGECRRSFAEEAARAGMEQLFLPRLDDDGRPGRSTHTLLYVFDET